MAIFRLYMKYLVSSYTRFIIYFTWFVYPYYYYSLIYFPLPPCFYLQSILTLLWDID